MENLQPQLPATTGSSSTSSSNTNRVVEMLRRLQESLMSEIDATITYSSTTTSSSNDDSGMLAETLMLDASEEDFQASQAPFSSPTTSSSNAADSISILEAIQRNLRISRSQSQRQEEEEAEDPTEFMPKGDPLDSSYSDVSSLLEDSVNDSVSVSDSDDSMHLKDLQLELDEAELKHGLEGSSRVKPMSQRTVSFNPFVSLLPVPPSFECSSSSSSDHDNDYEEEQEQQKQEHEPMFVYQEMELGHDDNFVGDIDETPCLTLKSPQQSIDESHTSRTLSLSSSEEDQEEEHLSTSHHHRDIESLSTEESPCLTDQENDNHIIMSAATALSMMTLHKMTNLNTTSLTSKHSAVAPEPMTRTHKHKCMPNKRTTPLKVSKATTKRMATKASQQAAYAASLGADMTRLVAKQGYKSKTRITTCILCCFLLLVILVMLILLIATTTMLFQQSTSIHNTTTKSICGNEGASQQELIRMGDVELIFQNMPTNININIGLDTPHPIAQLQQLFLDSYNTASGQCQGIFQRTLRNATIPNSIIHTNMLAGKLAHTQWDTMVECNGCPEYEPLFTIHDNHNNHNQRQLLLLDDKTTSIIDYQYNTTQEFLATFAELMNDGLSLIFSEKPVVRLVYVGVRSITTGDMVHSYEVPGAPTTAPSHAPSSAPSIAPTVSSVPSSFPTTDMPSSFPTESPTRYPVYIDRFAITKGRWTTVEGYEDMQDGVQIDLAELPTDWRLTAIPNTNVGIVRFWIDGQRAGADQVIHYVANHLRFPEIFENPNTGTYHLLEAQPEETNGQGLAKRSSLNFTVIDSRLLPDPPTTASTRVPGEPQVVTDQYFSCCAEEEIPDEGVGLGQFVQIAGGFCQVCEWNGETEPPRTGRMLRR